MYVDVYGPVVPGEAPVHDAAARRRVAVAHELARRIHFSALTAFYVHRAVVAQLIYKH